jgi:hypothetical protein
LKKTLTVTNYTDNISVKASITLHLVLNWFYGFPLPKI